MGLFTLGAHRIRGRGVGSSLGPLFFLPLFTNVVEEEFCELRPDGVLRSLASGRIPATHDRTTLSPHPAATMACVQ
jgi:hypothetical protein